MLPSTSSQTSEETRGMPGPAFLVPPSPAALNFPLSWILRLRPGAGSHTLTPVRGGREKSCSSQKLLLRFKLSPEQQR